MDLYPRKIQLSRYPAFQVLHAYVLGAVVQPITPNNHVYLVTVAGTSAAASPAWPTTTQTTVTSGTVTFKENGLAPGVQHNRFQKHKLDWKEITLINTYEDKGVDTNTSAAAPPQRWTLEYLRKHESSIKLLDDFWDAHRLTVPFTFVEPRAFPFVEWQQGNTVDDVYFEDYIENDQFDTRIWRQKRTVKLIKYPA